MPTKTIVHQSKLHWIVFVHPILLLMAGIALNLYFPLFYMPALLFVVFGALWFLMAVVTYQVSSVVVTPKQIILKTGLLVRQTFNMPLQKIESIDIRQSILGTLLNYGTLTLTGTGGTKNGVNYLQAPLTCRRHIEALLHGGGGERG